MFNRGTIFFVKWQLYFVADGSQPECVGVSVTSVDVTRALQDELYA